MQCLGLVLPPSVHVPYGDEVILKLTWINIYDLTSFYEHWLVLCCEDSCLSVSTADLAVLLQGLNL